MSLSSRAPKNAILAPTLSFVSFSLLCSLTNLYLIYFCLCKLSYFDIFIYWYLFPSHIKKKLQKEEIAQRLLHVLLVWQKYSCTKNFIYIKFLAKLFHRNSLRIFVSCGRNLTAYREGNYCRSIAQLYCPHSLSWDIGLPGISHWVELSHLGKQLHSNA